MSTCNPQKPESTHYRRIKAYCSQWFDKNDPHYLLNLFTVLLASSAIAILVFVGSSVYLIYSSSMIKNAETSAGNLINLMIKAEFDLLFKNDATGKQVATIHAADMGKVDQKMRMYLGPFDMHKIKFFSLDRTILYSTDPSLIGKSESSNAILNDVLNTSKPFSKLVLKRKFKDLSGADLADASIVEAYSVITDKNKKVIGAFEVYVDITKIKNDTIRVLWLTMASLSLVLGFCFFNLYLPMRRGTLNLIKAHLDLNDLATKDYLTGAYNRRYITDRAKEEFHRMRRQIGKGVTRHSLGFIMADIDFFKRVNDKYGHAAGDLVLQEVAIRLKAGLRDYDVFCRYGGEEFVVMLPHTNEDESMVVAQRLRLNVNQKPIDLGELGQLTVTVSFGVATSREGRETAHDVLLKADEALYKAKESGRDKVVLSD